MSAANPVYPTNTTIRTEVLNASSSSSNSNGASVGVPFRSILIDAIYAPGSYASQTAAGQVDITVNGTTAGASTGTTGWGQLSITTTTGTLATQLGPKVFSSQTVFLNPGDVLGTALSSCVGGNTAYVIRSF